MNDPIVNRAIDAHELSHLARVAEEALAAARSTSFETLAGGSVVGKGAATDSIWIWLTATDNAGKYGFVQVEELSAGLWVSTGGYQGLVEYSPGTGYIYFFHAEAVDLDPGLPVSAAPVAPTAPTDADTIVRAWLADDGTHWLFEAAGGGSGGSGTTNNKTIDYFNNTLTYSNNRTTFTAESWYVNNLTINAPVGNFGGISLNAWLEICGAQFWCCETYTFTTSTVTDWVIPFSSTVFPILPHSGGTTLSSIVPQSAFSVPQTSSQTQVSSDTTLTCVFPTPLPGTDYVVVNVWGTCPAGFSPSVTDPATDNFTLTALAHDPVSGIYASIWLGFPNAGQTSITFNSGGAAGPIVMIAQELNTLYPGIPSVDSYGMTGNSSTPMVGSIITDNKNQRYLSLTMATADPSSPATIDGPAGYANLYQQLDGVDFTVGSADYHVQPPTGGGSDTPTYTLDRSAPWAVVATGFKIRPGPQVLAFTNNSTAPFTIVHNGTFTPGLGFPIFLPPQYRDPIAGTWQVTLRQYDWILLWFDLCDFDGWRVAACSVSGFGASINVGNLVFEPHLNLVAGSGVTLTQADDPTNLRTSVTITATSSSSGGGGTTLVSGIAACANGFVVTVAASTYGTVGALSAGAGLAAVTMPNTGTYMFWCNGSWSTFNGSTIDDAAVFGRIYNATAGNTLGNTLDTELINNQGLNSAEGAAGLIGMGTCTAGDSICFQAKYTGGSGATVENASIMYLQVG